MQVKLTPKLREIVRRKVASGLYVNASEVICEALRMVAARERARARKWRILRRSKVTG